MRILVLSTIGVSHNAIENFKYKNKIVAIIGVHPNSSVVPQISGYADVSLIGEKLGIPYFYVTKYSLKSQEDKELFEGIEYDLIWVSGWQRLIPDWLITSASYGAIGGHGSADGITKGRGRSPQNWALLMGQTKFHIALFKITPFTDNGDIILERSFDLTQNDDIFRQFSN